MFICRPKEEGANPEEVKTPKKRGPKPKIKLDENGMPIEPKPKRWVVTIDSYIFYLKTYYKYVQNCRGYAFLL